MPGYRHAFYSPKLQQVTLQTWDETGEPITEYHPFKPYLFVETDKDTRFKSIFGTSIEPVTFETSYARRDYVDDYDGRVFHNLAPEQQFLIEKYRKVPQEEMLENPLRVFYLDIEVYSPDEFPAADKAKHPINAITIYDTKDELFHTWGLGEYDINTLSDDINFDETKSLKNPKKEQIRYYAFEKEKDLLQSFLQFWKNNYPDVLTNWNGEFFDIPYIVNRIKLLFADNTPNVLSPLGMVHFRERPDKFGNMQATYKIKGVSCLDYMAVFKVFTFGVEQPSWKLDSIASQVLKIGKIEYEESNLALLAQRNWNKFINYNIQDVNLLVCMDREKKYLEFARVCAYEGLTNFEDSLGKVNIIMGALAKRSINEGKFLITNKFKPKESFEGGFVRKPLPGIYTNFMTVDITSLYPTNMMVLNTSPETKVGHVMNEFEGMVDYFYKGETYTKPLLEFKQWCRDHSIARSGADILFTQVIPGCVSSFVEFLFNQKQEQDVQKKSLKQKIKDDPDNTEEYQRQMDYCEQQRSLIKVLVNSVYGVVSSNSSPLYDLDIARSVTLTGQAVIKKSNKVIDEFARSKFGVDSELCCAGDTDSAMVTLTPILESKNWEIFTDNVLNKKGEVLLDALNIYINTEMNIWAQNVLFTKKPIYNFNREKVCPAALLFAKKRYAFHVLDNEGEPCDVVKYTGLLPIQSTCSEKIKGMVDSIYKYVLYNYVKEGTHTTNKGLTKLIKDIKADFLVSTPDEVATRRKANNIKKYQDEFISDYKPGSRCPIGVKSSIFFNRLVDEHGLQGKYHPIMPGSKVKTLYLKPNKWQIDTIAFMDEFPQEFGLEIDYETQFQKTVGSPVDQLYETLKWRIPSLNLDDTVDLWELLGC